MGKFKDISGQVFGRLTVIETDGKTKFGAYLWKCKCDCGNEIIVVGNSLLTGNTQSCGCYLKETTSQRNFKDLTGLKFGRLKAVKIEGKYSDGNYCWLCLCDCGQHVRVRSKNLIAGLTQSCGCLWKEKIIESNFNDLTNKKFGKLTAIEIFDKNKYGASRWLCKCECGNTTISFGTGLVSGHTQSCGCLEQSKGSIIIEKYLDSNNIIYRKEYRRDDCKYINTLAFDFAIFNYNNNLLYLIEYQGQQHYYPVEYFGGQEAFNKYQIRDSIKANYCLSHSIHLLCIPYWEFNNIEQILDNFLSNFNQINIKQDTG